MLNDSCSKCGTLTDFTCYLVPIDGFTVFLGTLQVVGSFIPFVPQMIRFCLKRSTHGLSFFWLFLSTCNGFSRMINIYMSQFPQIVAMQNDFSLSMKNNFPALHEILLLIWIFIIIFQFMWYERLQVKRSIKLLKEECQLLQKGKVD